MSKSLCTRTLAALAAVAIGSTTLTGCGSDSSDRSSPASSPTADVVGVGDYKTANELLADRGLKDEAQNRKMLDAVCATAARGGSQEDAGKVLQAPPYSLNEFDAGYVIGAATLHVCAGKKGT